MTALDARSASPSEHHFSQKDGRTCHVRKATPPEADLVRLYEALDLAHLPAGVQKLVALIATVKARVWHSERIHLATN